MNISRRSFLFSSAVAPFFIGGCAGVSPRKISANSKVNVAIIGCGLIAKGTNVPGFLKCQDKCRITVACDMVKEAPNYFYGGRGSNFGAEGFKDKGGAYRRDVCGSTVIKSIIDKAYGNHDCREVFDWREVIHDPTIDAVCICTPDHWHALIAIAAMKAGKHVFCQKPMSLSIEQGKAMVKVAKETGVTFQVGNQGRSDPGVRLAEELLVNGYCGKILGATVTIPKGNHWDGHGYSPKRAPLPKYFSKEAWDLWQGPAEHWENDAYIPSIHEPTCWRFNKRYGNGMITDFGAHEFDVLQRGMGADLTGPVAVENMKTNLHQDTSVFSWASEFSFDFVYGNGVRVNVVNIDKSKNILRQCVFHTEKGDCGSYLEQKKVPAEYAKFKESDFGAKDKLLYAGKNGHDGEEWHEADFIDAIIEQRQSCAPCEVGHRTITLAHLANICQQLRTDKVEWDPKAEKFVGANASAATKIMGTEYHNGWELGA